MFILKSPRVVRLNTALTTTPVFVGATVLYLAWMLTCLGWVFFQHNQTARQFETLGSKAQVLWQVAQIRNLQLSKVLNYRSYLLLGETKYLSFAKDDEASITLHIEELRSLPQSENIKDEIATLDLLEKQHREAIHSFVATTGTTNPPSPARFNSVVLPSWEKLYAKIEDVLDNAEATTKSSQMQAESQLPDRNHMFWLMLSLSILVSTSIWIIYLAAFLTLKRKRIDLAQSSRQLEKVNESLTQRLQEVNDLNEELNLAQERILRTQKLESMGRLSGGIAHEFNNLLCGVSGYASLLEVNGSGDANFQRYVGIIKSCAARGGRLARQLLEFARKDDQPKVLLDLRTTLHEAEEILNGILRIGQIKIKLESPTQLPLIRAVPDQMIQILINLCLNARDAMPNGGTIQVTLAHEQLTLALAREVGLTPGKYIRLSVRDSGTGIPRAVRDRIFDPFFSTKPIGKGTGLGLSVVYSVLTNHGAGFKVSSEENKGTQFDIYFQPESVSIAEVHFQPPRTSRAYPNVKLPRIVIAEDETNLRELCGIYAKEFADSVCLVADGKAVIHELQKNGSQIPLLILDVSMPKMNGIETLTRARELFPKIRAILVSGNFGMPDFELVQEFGPQLRLLHKPFSKPEFEDALFSMLESLKNSA